MKPRFLMLVLAAPLLAGCVTVGPGSVKGGECRIFERPDYAVRGKQQYDQDWIDGNIEAGVGGCGWKRPKPRPASFDARKGHDATRPAPVKKRGLLKRIRDRAVHPFSKPVAPIVQSPPVVDRWAVPIVEPSPTPPPAAEPQPVPAPRDPVDELLHPDSQ